MRINYGCGRRVLPGYYNIDAQHNPKAPRAPEMIHALRFGPTGNLLELTPLEDGCAKEVHCYHLIEHFYAWEAPSVINEFRRLLRPGGLLVLELPNLDAACSNHVNGQSDQMTMWPLYGDPSHMDPYMCHKWGYTPETMKQLLKQCGMRKIALEAPRTHRRRTDRDMRVVSIAP